MTSVRTTLASSIDSSWAWIQMLFRTAQSIFLSATARFPAHHIKSCERIYDLLIIHLPVLCF